MLAFIALIGIFALCSPIRSQNVLFSKNNTDFDCTLSLNGYSRLRSDVLQLQSIVYNRQTCYYSPFQNGSTDGEGKLIGGISCKGTNKVTLRATFDKYLLSFKISCSAKFPLDFIVDKELSFRWRIYHEGNPEEVNKTELTLFGLAHTFYDWSSKNNNQWSLSRNYTIYSEFDPHLNITIELDMKGSTIALQERHQRGGMEPISRVRLTTDAIAINCKYDFADQTGMYLVSAGGNTPTETRILERCLVSKMDNCSKEIQKGVSSRFGKLIYTKQHHGVVYCSDGNNELVLYYFLPINGIDFVYNMSLMWEAENVIHLQKDDGLPYFFVPTSKSSPNASIKSKKLYESEYLDFECHFLPYFLLTPTWTAWYANGSSITIPSQGVTMETKKYQKYGLHNFTNALRSSHARIRCDATMIAVECTSFYWNYARTASAFHPMNISRLSEATLPAFKNQDSFHDISLGLRLQLNCSVDIGDPEPSYTWKFYGKQKHALNETDSPDTLFTVAKIYSTLGSNASALLIQAFGIDMEGEYVCFASNIRGTASRHYHVKLREDGSWGAWFYWVICVGIIAVLGAIVLILTLKFYRQRGHLTEMEVKLFEKGNEKELRDDKFGHENAQFMPYNKEFELKWNDFVISEEKLGEGEYGVVYKGSMASAITKTVAIKTVKEGADKTEILALLSEIKVMIHLENHDNVVKLVGACTSYLKEGRVYAVVEFCPLGSLISYLRKADKKAFVQTEISFTNANLESHLNYDSVDNLATKDLVAWSIQIARGMQHLEHKKVIHGDLAARNVLLFNKTQVKITDFGLSRQLVNYENYVKKTQAKLPWRWLAPETLKSLVFSHKSDVWAYGVTLWEIFTLGLLPYPGMSWTTEFVEHLEDNLRLHQPKFAPGSIYKIMTSCWEIEPGNRPDFQQLELALGSLAR